MSWVLVEYWAWVWFFNFLGIGVWVFFVVSESVGNFGKASLK
jgi:hypothetical protein